MIYLINVIFMIRKEYKHENLIYGKVFTKTYHLQPYTYETTINKSTKQQSIAII